MLSKWIFVPEKLPRKCLVDDRHVPRGCCVLPGNTASSQNRIPDDVKVSRGHPVQRGEGVIPGTRRRMPLHGNAAAPIVAAQGRVFAESHRGNTWNARYGIMNSLVKQRELVQAVAGSPWIDICHSSPILIESEIL